MAWLATPPAPARCAALQPRVYAPAHYIVAGERRREMLPLSWFAPMLHQRDRGQHSNAREQVSTLPPLLPSYTLLFAAAAAALRRPIARA